MPELLVVGVVVVALVAWMCVAFIRHLQATKPAPDSVPQISRSSYWANTAAVSVLLFVVTYLINPSHGRYRIGEAVLMAASFALLFFVFQRRFRS
jgi:uncharacterized BrkB/YihY/UPF0761 family membrane protein